MVPAAGRGLAGERGEELVLALALEGDDADDLAVAELEGDVLDLAADAEAADREARRPFRARRRRRVAAGDGAGALDAGAEHKLDDAVLGAGGDVDDADGLAVAEDGGAVAERGDLEEAVGNEDDGAALGTLAADDVEDALGEIGGEGGGHLVEEEDVGLERECAGEVEDADGGERQVAGEGRRGRARGGRGPRPSRGRRRPGWRSGGGCRRR